ncbi:MAG: cellulose synthase/poly-beta-1,6-N-acetylglucosamine synthase-like glycosyltransferase [Candidatus Deianiraeaceae bacterium]|jgi:cellulose synthase/poly-beta-1,6-N-acetylglucosamine synthase-like glycosyltransferase
MLIFFLCGWSLFLLSVGVVKIFIIVLGHAVRVRGEFSTDSLGHKPMYTILVPMFGEVGADIDDLRASIANLDYENIEVLYLCESIDVRAYNYFANTQMRVYEKVVYIPFIPPLTKPRACNYGLELAKGEFIVIYDIEDRPHSKQLSIAFNEFYLFNYHCIQFPLEFVVQSNALDVWQKIDYLVWYKRLLPVLMYFNAPIPLGGTSNHFKVSYLRSIGGWNPLNVTEDAELGLRMFLKNAKVRFVPIFQTKERPIPNLLNLKNQRVRWAKGHILTAISFLFNGAGSVRIVDIFWVFLVLLHNAVTVISCLLLAMFYRGGNIIVLSFFIAGVILFLLSPFVLLFSFRELRRRNFIAPTLFYGFYTIMYVVPIVQALIECILKPNTWYKTKR